MTKLLGVVTDEKPKWSDHCQYIRDKISQGLRILSKAKKVFTAKTLIILYYTFIYPYLIYGIEVRGSTFEDNIELILSSNLKSMLF